MQHSVFIAELFKADIKTQILQAKWKHRRKKKKNRRTIHLGPYPANLLRIFLAINKSQQQKSLQQCGGEGFLNPRIGIF